MTISGGQNPQKTVRNRPE